MAFLWPALSFICEGHVCVLVCVGVCWGVLLCSCVYWCVLFGVSVSVGESGRVLFGESVC